MGNRQVMTIVFIVCFALLCLLSKDNNQAFGQVTFSRDWTPGKRNGVSMNDCSIRPAAASICQMIMNEIHHLAACEARSIMNHIHEDSIDPNRI